MKVQNEKFQDHDWAEEWKLVFYDDVGRYVARVSVTQAIYTTVLHQANQEMLRNSAASFVIEDVRGRRL